MLEDTFIFDADSHWCEPPDLFTKIAPPEYRDRVPRVEEVDGQKMWVFDGHPVGRFSAGGVIARDGSKEEANIALHEWEHEQRHWRLEHGGFVEHGCERHRRSRTGHCGEREGQAG